MALLMRDGMLGVYLRLMLLSIQHVFRVCVYVSACFTCPTILTLDSKDLACNNIQRSPAICFQDGEQAEQDAGCSRGPDRIE